MTFDRPRVSRRAGGLCISFFALRKGHTMPVGDTRKIPRGTSYRINIEYLRDGAPRTLVGATIRFTIKPARYDSDTDDSSATFAQDVTVHDDAAGGLSHVGVAPSDTSTFPPDEYFYDIKVQESSGEVFLLEEGEMLITGSPTNRFD